MYCPKCGTQNTDDASFCRGCGANVSLVPQALAGHMPETIAGVQPGAPVGYEREPPPNLSHAIVRIFVGIAF
ncbi:MAG TPA: zinc-ribbon domain-containing protein, partial [Pyrinomonadaceae bacterium]